jgi:hypothetical protein
MGPRGYVGREKPPKTPTSRSTISLAPSAVAVLQRQRAEQRERRIHCGLGRDQDCFVFDRLDGWPLGPPTPSSDFAKLVRHAKLPHVRFHNFLHTFASTSLQAGVDLKTISASLDHSTVSVTADLYAHVHETLRVEHAALVESVMGGALASAVCSTEMVAVKSKRSQKAGLGAENARKIGRLVVAPTRIEPVIRGPAAPVEYRIVLSRRDSSELAGTQKRENPYRRLRDCEAVCGVAR